MKWGTPEPTLHKDDTQRISDVQTP